MKKIVYIPVVCALLILISCEKSIISPEETNTPENNFQIVWEDFDKHYALFIPKKVNWNSLYKIYRPQVTSATTQPQLWEIVTKMLNHLNDGHTTIENPAMQWFFESGDSLNVLA